jgi:N-carbamoyl-L-amino-acid hydrolase
MESFYPYGGTADGGMHRLALSPEDGAARDHLVAWMREQDLRVSIDPIGNVFGLLDWAGPDAPVVMSGSHLDSQPKGGRYDGAYGVVAACEALTAVKERALALKVQPKCNLAVADWTNEEGARFQPSLLGSGVYAGMLELSYALDRIDGDGMSARSALEAIGYDGKDHFPRPQAYVELHVECADVLERAGKRFGAITHHWGAVKYRLAFIGRQAHTGPTPMSERKDALLAAAHLIVALRGLSDRTPLVLHTSVGRCEVSPNSPNVVPGEAVLFIELRSSSQEILDKAEREMLEAAERAVDLARVRYEVRAIDRRPVGFFDTGLFGLAKGEAEAVGIDTVPLDTIAGHDAVAMIGVCPSLVINVPSVGGICHHPSEYTKPEDLELGTEILTRMLWHMTCHGLPERTGKAFEDGRPH